MKPVSLGPFAGMNNRLPESKLATADAAFVRNAVNVDLNAAGTFSRRAGTTQQLAGVECHSLWSSAGVAFYVDGSKLYRISGPAEALEKTEIATVTPGLRMSYADTGLDVRASNGVQALRISRSGAVSDWAVPTPRYLPLLSAAGGGSLAAGVCRAVVSYTNALGEEGATGYPVTVYVPENGVITVSGIAHVAGLTTNLYLTPANGDVFYLAGQPTGTSFVIPVAPDNSVRPVGLLLAPLSAGQIVRLSLGRLLSALGNILHFSEVRQLGLANPAKNYIQFPEAITMLEPCKAGVYVSAGKTYWIPGDVASGELIEVLPYGATPGASGETPDGESVWWMSERGLVIGDRSGAVKNVQERNVAVDSAVVGAAMFREQDGMKQVVASLFSPESTGLSARSYMDAEIVRKETEL